MFAGSVSLGFDPLQLVNGPNLCAGRAEVLHNQQGGTVCDDNWLLPDTAVLCRQLGCGMGLPALAELDFREGLIPSDWMMFTAEHQKLPSVNAGLSLGETITFTTEKMPVLCAQVTHIRHHGAGSGRGTQQGALCPHSQC